MLTLEELYRIAEGFINRSITKIRLTGGEPLVRQGLMELVTALGRRIVNGFDELDHYPRDHHRAALCVPRCQGRVDLRAAIRSNDPEAQLQDGLDLAMRIKQRRYRFAIQARDKTPALARHMSMTGG